uniref:Secreted protein n=1 Tax=Peronospora matthiolae TaxID=2874970 RepID=A0AAV1U1P4_9STRA
MIVAVDLVTTIFFSTFFSLVVDESDDDVVDESDNDAGGPEVCDARNAFVACACAS